MNTKHYTYRVTWSLEDGEHGGLCAELPSLGWLASGEAVPVALAEKNYSGEFRVRIPPLLHRNLALMSAAPGVSLNRLASAKLAA